MSESLYFKDEAWMKYHKCPLCGRYVLKEPKLIKMPRASAGTRKIIRWNAVLLYIIFDKKTTPCIKCVSDLTRYLIIYYNRDQNTSYNEEVIHSENQ